MNKRTTALTTEQYKEIILTLKEGACGFRPNERVATALVLEGNLGLKDMQNYYEKQGANVPLSFFITNWLTGYFHCFDSRYYFDTLIILAIPFPYHSCAYFIC